VPTPRSARPIRRRAHDDEAPLLYPADGPPGEHAVVMRGVVAASIALAVAGTVLLALDLGLGA
jgi:hypothetical protein